MYTQTTTWTNGWDRNNCESVKQTNTILFYYRGCVPTTMYTINSNLDDVDENGI